MRIVHRQDYGEYRNSKINYFQNKNWILVSGVNFQNVRIAFWNGFRK